MLLRGEGLSLGAKDLESSDQLVTSLTGLDHLVDEAELGCHIGIVEPLLVIGDEIERTFSGSLVALISRRWMMFTAPCAPITAISADGQAKTRSARIPRAFTTRYAPPYAFRVMTVIRGTVASQ